MVKKGVSMKRFIKLVSMFMVVCIFSLHFAYAASTESGYLGSYSVSGSVGFNGYTSKVYAETNCSSLNSNVTVEMYYYVTIESSGVIVCTAHKTDAGTQYKRVEETYSVSSVSRPYKVTGSHSVTIPSQSWSATTDKYY